MKMNGLGRIPVGFIRALMALFVLSSVLGASSTLPCFGGQVYTPCAAGWEFKGPGGYINEGDPLKMTSASRH